ncbi:MAG: hypothetical protein M5R40_12555 [Anaerolineae bacterium]|nr:hypothetical protein [Anaerolineae bacterium]
MNGHLCSFAVFHHLLTQDRISPAPRVIVFEMEDIVRAVLVLCLLLFMGVETQSQPAPTIEYFTVDNHALDYPAVEAGVEAANFSWRVVGLREGDQMQMHALVGGQWRLIGAGFAPEKTDQLVIAHPLDFIPPTYRLSVVDAAGTPVAEHVLELSYAPPEGPPTVSMFLAFPPVEIIPLSAFDEPFHVQWRVSNRWFNSNLVFEQVLPDGTILNAEYPRPAGWQYAHKADYLHIVYPGDYQDVVLQLRVVNRDDGSTLAREQLTLHVDNNVAPQPEAVTFTVSPETAQPGETVTLAWEVVNTDVVFIEYHDGNPSGRCAGNLERVYELPTKGTVEITTPEAAYSALQFRLFADFYIEGTRHNCSSPQTPLGELSVSLTDYIGQGVEYFGVEPPRSLSAMSLLCRGR